MFFAKDIQPVYEHVFCICIASSPVQAVIRVRNIALRDEHGFLTRQCAAS